MSDVIGNVYVAPLSAQVPKDAITPLDKSYYQVGYIEDASLMSMKLFSIGKPYCRILMPLYENNVDTEIMPKGAAIWVLDLIVNNKPTRVVFPKCRDVKAFMTDSATIELILKPLDDDYGYYRYDYLKE